MPPEELTLLLDRYGPALTLFARQWSAAAEDAVQEAFLKLVRLKTRPRDPVAYLYRVTRNAAIDHSRADRRRVRREQSVASEEWFIEQTAGDFSSREVINSLQQLEETQRAILVARFWGGLTFEQIAEVLSCSSSAAHRRYETGLARLRELMKPCPKSTP